MRQRRWLFSMLAALASGAAVLSMATPSGAQPVGTSPLRTGLPRTGPVRLPADAPAHLPHDAVAVGALPARTIMHLDVMLRLRHPAALTAFIAALSDRRSREFRHFLRPRQFGVMFGPTLAEVAAVEAALRAQGLDPGPVSPDRLAIPVTGSAASVDRAFGTRLATYRLSGGRTAYANTVTPRVSAAEAADVQGVVGLSDVYRPRSLAALPAGRAGTPASARGTTKKQAAQRPRVTRRSAGPQPCAAASAAAASSGSYTADQLAGYYAMSPLYAVGDLGQKVRVALAEFEPDAPADIAAYEACYGLTTPVRYVAVNGGPGTGAGSGEAALDIEDVMGLAPDVSIDVYQAPNGGDTDTYGLYAAIVNADTDAVVSTSWGICEPDADASLTDAEHDLFAQAAAQGQTVLAAAGDYGSTACGGDGSANADDLAVSDPASQPYVVGVGGTSIGPAAETVWNNSSIENGAGGGGASRNWCMPAYQDQSLIPGLLSRNSALNGTCPSAVPYMRQVPDVSADANPETGYLYYYNGTWAAIGGTSGAAPLWAAVAALTDASPFCRYYGSGEPGVQPEGLYAVAASDHSYIYSSVPEALYDVTAGNNDYTPTGYAAGLYRAGRGYDMASGLGTPLASGFTARGGTTMYYPGLAALMCWEYGTRLRGASVSRVYPARGPSARTQRVTIWGQGFLPVPGTDIVYVGSRHVVASCPTSTRCTVTLPVMKQGTFAVRMSVEDLTLSPVTFQNHYSFIAAPSVTHVSPVASHRTVEIRGTNFIGVRSVRFGTAKAKRFSVVSATEIIATVPAGMGTVAVTVGAAGGISAPSTHSNYRYDW
jgi:subtilase family serine protease